MDNYLQTKSWQEAKELIKSSKGVAIIPIGSVEQHGYHLPIGTDTYVAITLAEDAAKETGAIIVPPVWFGWSPHHMVLPG
ncbi:MAG: creatininase family protein, partial [Clostridia bacterium]|nr:creatininase family protein [Clostridia bacterium]